MTGFFAFIYLLFSVIPPLLSKDSDPTLRVVLVVNCVVQIIQIILQIAFFVDLEKKVERYPINNRQNLAGQNPTLITPDAADFM